MLLQVWAAISRGKIVLSGALAHTHEEAKSAAINVFTLSMYTSNSLRNHLCLVQR